MSEGMPQLIAAEIDSYAVAIAERDIARDAAVCLEQELAAAEAQLRADRPLETFAAWLTSTGMTSLGPISTVREYLRWCAGGEP